MTKPASELIALADELDGWHDCADGDVSAGNGHCRRKAAQSSDGGVESKTGGSSRCLLEYASGTASQGKAAEATGKDALADIAQAVKPAQPAVSNDRISEQPETAYSTDRQIAGVAPSPSGTTLPHHRECGWRMDQYPWECTCGALSPGPSEPKSQEPDAVAYLDIEDRERPILAASLAELRKHPSSKFYADRFVTPLYTHPTTKPEAQAVSVAAIKRIICGIYGVGSPPFSGGHQDKSINSAATAISTLFGGR